MEFGALAWDKEDEEGIQKVYSLIPYMYVLRFTLYNVPTMFMHYFSYSTTRENV